MRESNVRLIGVILLLGSVLGVVWVAASNPPVPEPDELIKPGPADPDAPEEFTTTESGLRYRILRKSDGPKPTEADTVRVHYKGKLEDGRLIDSSYKRGDMGVFTLGKGVIKGWTEALQLVGEGGMIEMWIPPELAYGKRGRSGIPSNATLYFLIELIEIMDAPEAPVEEEATLKPGPVDDDAPEEFTETPSGLQYRILRKSDGPKPSRFDIVLFHVRTWVQGEDDTLHSSYEVKRPIRRSVPALVPAMAEGMQLVSEGGMIELLVPSQLRPQFERDPSLVPSPGQPLRRIVELLDVQSLFSERIGEEDVPEEFIETDTGLKYRILKESDGKRPTLQDTVTVNYIGWRDSDGSEFDGTYNRSGPSTFSLSQGLIKAWPEALQLIGEGGIIEIVVPPQLGYGLLGNPPKIPPDETLHFAIELLEIR